MATTGRQPVETQLFSLPFGVKFDASSVITGYIIIWKIARNYV